MTRCRLPPPGELVLFGPVLIHLARRSAVTGGIVCAWCRASLAVAGDWGRLEGCHDCPGLVVPASPWALLTAEAPPADAVELDQAEAA